MNKRVGICMVVTEAIKYNYICYNVVMPQIKVTQ